MLRVPKYRASRVDAYREHLRKRRAEDPSAPVKHLFEVPDACGQVGHLGQMHGRAGFTQLSDYCAAVAERRLQAEPTQDDVTLAGPGE
jgi:hypothetical protein